MSDIHVVVLAAGKGTRMKSAVPKVLHRAAGRSLIEYAVLSAASLSPASIVIVLRVSLAICSLVRQEDISHYVPYWSKDRWRQYLSPDVATLTSLKPQL